MKRNGRILLFASPAVVLLLVWLIMKPFGRGSDSTPDTALSLVESDSVTFWVTGDAMMHLPQYTMAKNEKTGLADFDSCYTHLRSILPTADVRLLNFETTLAGPPYAGYPKFCAPREYADALRKAGFNFFVFANNHSCDRGSEGIEGNIDYADSVGLWHTGIFRDQAERNQRYPFILQVKGFSIAMLNCTYGTNGIATPEPWIVNRIDTLQLADDLAKARALKPDAIIVSIHWGTEYQHAPNHEQKAIADFLWRNGTDVIIGSHPHVVQPMEIVTPIGQRHEKLVMWSMGNFISNQKDPLTDAGLLVGFTIKKTAYGEPQISHVKYIPLYRHKTDSRKPGYFVLPGMITEKQIDRLIPDAETQEDFHSVMADTRKKMQTDARIREVAR